MLKCSVLFTMKEIIIFMTACKLVIGNYKGLYIQCKHMDVHCISGNICMLLHTHEIGMTGPRSQVTTCLSIKLSCTCTSTIHLLKMYISTNAVQGYTIIPISKGMQVTSNLIPSITTITLPCHLFLSFPFLDICKKKKKKRLRQ